MINEKGKWTKVDADRVTSYKTVWVADTGSMSREGQNLLTRSPHPEAAGGPPYAR